MKLAVIYVGKAKDQNLAKLINDYAGRISYDASLETFEIKDSDINEETVKIIRLIEKRKDNVYVIALGEEGVELSSKEFARKLRQLSATKTIIFIVGGPFGLSEKIKNKSDLLLSLSNMTFTHEMARLILVEQIYRAISIIKNRNYHKE